MSIVLLFILLSCGKSQVKLAVGELNDETLSTEQVELISRYTKVFPNNTQISFALINNGNVTFYGIIRENDTLRSTQNQDRIYEIGSISKVFTSTILANLHLNESIDLNSDIQSHFDFPIQLPNISFKELANHTSGLPRLPSNLNLLEVDQSNPYKTYGEEELLEYLKDATALNSQPGESYAYSNLGAGLLGYILTQRMNQSYEDLLDRLITGKFNMNSTTIQKMKVNARLVKGLDPYGAITPNWELNVLVGAGGILSNVEDMSKFALAQFNDENVALATTRAKTFTVNQNMSIGMGWHILNRPSDEKWIWHNGGTGGYTSSMAVNIEMKNAVIVLSNVSAFNSQMSNIDQLCFALMDTF